ncbi:MAG: hypothetical protein C4527_08955 [Candidatus Omnitrophota bacterium]|jgi:hypothetical protein|nr:MAG: hypothetical protein C4527_08955 [Candidatus Omnitrophota bacterium]
MRTITIDDHTYTTLQLRADSVGLSIEEWLKQSIIRSDPRTPEEFTIEERLARFDAMMDTIAKMDIRSECNIDWSRESIYKNLNL